MPRQRTNARPAQPNPRGEVARGGRIALRQARIADRLDGDHFRTTVLTDPAALATLDSINLYALAVVLWELLTGRLPFDDERSAGESDTSLERMIELRRQPVPDRFAADIPPDCPPVLRHALLITPRILRNARRPA
ncbi:hypothetical protein [Nocardia sp. CA-120079]|uniref:hypothetical protein n=1 Tax=Nocardia sp. CA-120079 TaxID=3239974 RepID=UPI003D964764